MNREITDKETLTERVKMVGFPCRECGHKHSGEYLDYICIGCPCDFVPDFDSEGFVESSAHVTTMTESTQPNGDTN